MKLRILLLFFKSIKGFWVNVNQSIKGGNRVNLLIIDDELSAIKVVENSMNWASLDFDNIYTAMSKRSAIEIIQNNDVNIILSDIEMPMGSGLELLEWVKSYYPNICCIFMTCHADFAFAQKAIQLGCMDYILKPLDFKHLEKVLIKVIQVAREEECTRENSMSWIENKEALLKQFWMEFFVGEISPDEESITKYIQKKHLTLNLEYLFLPILISVKKWSSIIVKEDYRLFHFVLRNTLQESFAMSGVDNEVISFSSNMILLMLMYHPKNTSELNQAVENGCQTIIQISQDYFEVRICCYIGEADKIYAISNQFELLQMMDFNNVVYSQNILYLQCYLGKSLEYRNQIFARWERMFKLHHYAQIDKEIKEFIENQNLKKINRNFLNAFYRDFSFLIFGFLYANSIGWEEFFVDEEAILFSDEGQKSIEGLLFWITYTLQKIDNYRKESYQGNSVKKVMRYIDENISSELSLEELAKYVHLNADYLTRVFKKQNGQSVSQYIISQRLIKAKWLMENTSSAIGDIAKHVGYDNYSSFNRVFTKALGVSPQEYKKQMNRSEKEM